MATTFNRKPINVGTPSSSNIEQHFFNHFNWKGINQNRNFLAVDQETFSDANNIYVDEEGLLKSRPPLKFLEHFDNKILQDCINYNEVILFVYKQATDDKWYLGIYQDDDWISYNVENYSLPLKSFRNGNLIYIFTDNGILTYDINKKSFSATKMYEPVTRIYSGSDFSTFEDTNLFSNYVKYNYLLYPSIAGDWVQNAISDNAIGKVGTYSHYINETKVTHEVTIDENKTFLNIIHQPLVSSTQNYTYINCYNDVVPISFVIDDFIYKYDVPNQTLYRASISDMLYEKIATFIYFEDDSGEFVKLKYCKKDDVLLVIYSQSWSGYVISTGELLDDGNLFSSGYTDIIDVYVFTHASDSIEPVYAVICRDKSIITNLNNKLVFVFNLPNHVYYYILSSINAGTINDFKSFANTSFAHGEIDIATYSGDTSEYYIGFALYYYIPGFCRFNDIGRTIKKDDGYNLSFRMYLGNSTVTSSYNYYTQDKWTGIGQPRFRQAVPTVKFEETSFTPKLYGFIYGEIYNSNGSSFTSKKLHFGLLRDDMTDIEYHINIPEDDTIGNMRDEETGTHLETSSYWYYYNKSALYGRKEYRHLLIYLNDGWHKITDRAGEFLLLSDKYWLYLFNSENIGVSNYRKTTQEISVKIQKENEYPVNGIDVLLKSNDIFVSKNNQMYIGNIYIDENDEEYLYFKKSNYNELDNKILGFHPISDTEIAIFTEHDTLYNVLSEGVYFYKHSKIVPTLKGKSELITLLDSTTTFMPSINGIVSLSYQNFINTTEQSTLYVTQDLDNIYNEFSNEIKSINFKYYTIFYEINNNTLLIYDNRYAAWWKWSVPVTIQKLFDKDNNLTMIADNDIYEFVVNSPNEYCDTTETEEIPIDWHFESQKLHLNANNYYKHIVNLTLASVEEGEYPISIDLNVKNYRKYVDNGKAENFDYDIDVIRTYVKRLNYAKVCEFQYKLSSDTGENGAAHNVQLALSSIAVKYKIGGQVR